MSDKLLENYDSQQPEGYGAQQPDGFGRQLTELEKLQQDRDYCEKRKQLIAELEKPTPAEGGE